jgi:hypothetical protein
MDFLTYLTTPSAFDGVAWGLLISEGLIALAGLYVGFLRSDTHPLKSTLQRLGIALVAIGALGIIASVLWLSGVDPFTQPIWAYVLTIVGLLVLIYTVYYWQVRYPALRSAYDQQNRRGSSRRNSTAARPAPAARPAAVQASGEQGQLVGANGPATPSRRRNARREHKRRNK